LANSQQEKVEKIQDAALFSWWTFLNSVSKYGKTFAHFSLSFPSKYGDFCTSPPPAKNKNPLHGLSQFAQNKKILLPKFGLHFVSFLSFFFNMHVMECLMILFYFW